MHFNTESRIRMNKQNYKPLPFYFINTTKPEELDAATAERRLRDLADAGFGGAVLFNKPPDGFDREQYLSEFWFETIGHFLAAAEKLHLEIWINDGWDYPPGDAGNRIRERAPELVQMRLTLKDGEAVPVVCSWGFPAFEEPESSRLFIELVYEEYRKRFRKYFGNVLRGFFSDADNRRYNHFTRAEMKGERYYPWSRNFAAVFQRKYGYDILPLLKEIMTDEKHPASLHYWELASELYQNWFRNNYQWCIANGLEYAFHTSDTGPFPYAQCDRSSVFTEGETLRLLSWSSRPGTDHELAELDGGTHYDSRYFTPKAQYGGSCTVNPHFHQTKWDLRAKYAASAAWLHGRERVLCEAFAATNWSSSPELLRRIAAWQIMQGINFFIPHAVHHVFRGATKIFAPPELLHLPGIRELNGFLEKYSFIAAQGKYAGPVRIADPTRKIWQGAQDSIFDLCDELSRRAVNYVVVPDGSENPDIPEEFASFDGGELAWMLRELADGTRYILAANIWADRELSGTLVFNGRKYPAAFAPGEIGVFGGPYECWRRSTAVICSRELPMPCPVQWNQLNNITLFQPGEFTVEEKVGELRLLVPTGTDVRLDGAAFSGGKPCPVFDDAYTEYVFEPEPGVHKLDFSGVQAHTPVYLRGGFDVSTEQLVFQSYEMSVAAPALRLAPRRKQLSAGSWADQGQVFYSGSADYFFTAECLGENALEVFTAGNTAELFIDEEPAGRHVWAPYEFRFPALHGRHEFRVRLTNTNANQLEGWRAVSGILAPPRLKIIS